MDEFSSHQFKAYCSNIQTGIHEIQQYPITQSYINKL